MYRWELKRWLMWKAISLSKHHARQGLVMVDRVVDKPGILPYHQKFYVRPDMVEPTDKVLSGHHNLPPGHPQRPDKARALNSAAPVTPDIKQQTENFYSTFPNRGEFYNALRNLGLNWVDSPTNPGLTLMRAKMALNNAQMNGMKIDDVKFLHNNPHIHPISVPSLTHPAPVATKSTQDLAQEFIDSFPTPKEFCGAMDSMKIPYSHSYDPSKNLKGARQSLISNMENGVNIPALWKTDLKQLYDSLPTPPPAPLFPAMPSSVNTKTFATVGEANNFFLGNPTFDKPANTSPYGKWLGSVPSIKVRDMDDGLDKWLVKLERKMINIYTRHSRDFNHWLRGTFSAKTWGVGSFNNIPQLIHFFRRAKLMDDAISRFEVPQPITVHRHMPCTPELLDKILEAPDGIFSDDSYMSTSCLSTMEPKLAKKFKDTLKWNETPVHLEIDIPQGTGWGMYVAADSAYPNQCEFLLARGSQLKIESIQKQPDGSYRVKCKLIGNTQKDVTKLKYRQFSKNSQSNHFAYVGKQWAAMAKLMSAQLLKSSLLSKIDKPDEDQWERFVTPLDFKSEMVAPEHKAVWC